MDSVLVFSGLDPCGGAGIVADVETINQFGLTPLSIITNLTVQSTVSVKSLNEVDSDLIIQQFNHLQEDVDFAVVKIGLLSSVEQIKVIAQLVKNKTIILDPIIKSSSDFDFLDKPLIAALVRKLLPITKIITPNLTELRALAGEQNEQKAVQKLNCNWVLVTRTDISDFEIEHRLYQNAKLMKTYTYEKLSGDYHGSGCTLASAVAALVAQDLTIQDACQQALDYTYQTLLNAKSVGSMQYHLNRQTS